MRDELFPGFQTINREGFISILGEMWDKWAPDEVILKAAKQVGISKSGLNVDHMQQDKFQQAANIMNKDQDSSEKPVHQREFALILFKYYLYITLCTTNYPYVIVQTCQIKTQIWFS